MYESFTMWSNKSLFERRKTSMYKLNIVWIICTIILKIILRINNIFLKWLYPDYAKDVNTKLMKIVLRLEFTIP